MESGVGAEARTRITLQVRNRLVAPSRRGNRPRLLDASLATLAPAVAPLCQSAPSHGVLLGVLPCHLVILGLVGFVQMSQTGWEMEREKVTGMLAIEFARETQAGLRI